MTPDYPKDIQLNNPPLIEAWLEIRWELDAIDPPSIMRDPGLRFALGWFYSGVRERFPYREPLQAAEAPEDIMPYIVRYRFRTEENGWPLVQLGPGVATINHSGYYNWEQFSENAEFLRVKLLEAYKVAESELKSETIHLRYKNSEPFDYKNDDVIQFLSEYLNLGIQIPSSIPGRHSKTGFLSNFRTNLEFALDRPNGVGTIIIGTATRNDTCHILWETSVISSGKEAPSLEDKDRFHEWLDAAHDINHEWFFSLIEGPLKENYS